MNILNIMQCTNLGGMEQASLRLMKVLLERGHAVQVISLNTVGELRPLLEAAGLACRGLGYDGRWGWRSAAALRSSLSSAKPEAMLMTGHNLMALLAIGGLCKGRRVLAIHFHHEGVKPRWQWKLIYWLACRRFRAITFPSDFVRQEAVSLWPPVSKIAQTVRNPLALPQMTSAAAKQAARRELGIADSVPVLGNAGWLIQRKRFDVFLRVAKEVSLRHPGARFLIAGDGPEKQALQQLATDLGISSNVHWLGWRRDLAFFFQSLDLVIFNSDWDAFPTTPLEAMSYGVPVVASVMKGGLSEIIQNDSLGILLESHDTSELAAQALALLQDAQRRQAMGVRAREEVASTMCPAEIAGRVLRLLAPDAKN